MTSKAQLSIPKEQLAVFCRRHHIRKLSLFGSVLREDFRPDSDVDVLVEFVPGNVPGFIRLGSIEEELEQLFDGRKVDLPSDRRSCPWHLSGTSKSQPPHSLEIDYWYAEQNRTRLYRH